VFFLSIVPLAAGFIGGFRRGAIWALICAGLGLGALGLGHAGFTFPDPDPDPVLTMSLNFVFQLVLSLVFAKTYTEERERTLLQVRAADRAKSIFLANVSHEIRTPMNGVVGMTEVLLRDTLTAPQREQLEVIQRSGRSLVLLINDLLDLARLEEGHFELAVVRFEIRALVSDLLALYAPLASEKGLTLVTSVEEAVPRAVRGDALRLRQVLSNLVSNAIKFTPSGEVRLVVTREGDQTRFAVVDTGPGISAAARPRLFERFEQGDASATRRAGGTGLGLSLSRDLVKRMGGALQHDASHAPGSRFHFALPLPLAAADLEPVAARPLTRVATGTPGRVLVVDDNPVNLAVARGLISRAGYPVHTVSNGRAALEEVQASEWCLVLMDLQMPEMDGLEATRLIRALPGTRARVPIVALTASAMPEEVAACRLAGMDDVLAKPIDVEALSATLKRYAAAWS
jgi:signal transduction histidine kinase/CheY-like chemotaxis protein